MRWTTLIRPILTIAAVGGIAALAYATRDRWTPHVFPTRPTAASEPIAAEHDAGGGCCGTEETHDHGPAGDSVKLSPQAQANLGLDKEGAVDVLFPKEHWRYLTIPGIVSDRPGECERVMTSSVPGIVTEIRARPGDTVKPGDPLFTIQLVSEFLQTTQTELAKTSRDLEAAIVRRDQTKKLVEAGSKPGIELIDEDNQVKRLTTQVQGYRRQLLIFGLSSDQVAKAEKGDIITEITFVAPTHTLTHSTETPGTRDISVPIHPLYEVQELRVKLGEQVMAGQTLCLLAIHQHLYIEGRAFKSEAAALAEAAEKKIPIEVVFTDEVPGSWSGSVGPFVIHHMANIVDPGTRTFAFYLPLENQERTFERDGRTYYSWRFRPGQRVRLKVPIEKLGDNVLVLPAGAVVREGPEAFVFSQSGDVFKRKPVHILYEDREEVVIANDGSISPVEYLVRTPAAGAINRALKASGAEPAGHDHDHGH